MREVLRQAGGVLVKPYHPTKQGSQNSPESPQHASFQLPILGVYYGLVSGMYVKRQNIRPRPYFIYFKLQTLYY